MSLHPADTPLRRGACPRLAAPMPTGDGLLARLACAGLTIGLDAMAALGAAARRHGNGIIEVTARGNIQVRGLSADSAAPFAAAAAALGIDAGDAVAILVDPLAGRHRSREARAGAATKRRCVGRMRLHGVASARKALRSASTSLRCGCQRPRARALSSRAAIAAAAAGLSRRRNSRTRGSAT